MNLRQIEVFRAVMLAGSVTGGAAQLHVSAPAVSRLLSHLESRLGVRLFERRGTGLQPTPEAQSLMREIDTAYRHIDRVRQAADALRHGGGTRLRVASNLSTALELVPRAAARLLETRPGLALSVDVAPLQRLREGLEAHEFDLGVGAFLELDAAGLTQEDIGQGELLVVLPAGHALCRAPSVPAADLRAQNLIDYGSAGPHGRQLRRLLGLEGQDSQLAVPYAYMAAALVASGQGVAVVDDLTLRHFTQSGVQLRPLQPRLHYRVTVLRDARRVAPAAADAFVQALREAWQALERAPVPEARPSAAPGLQPRRRTRQSPPSGSGGRP